LIVALDFPRLAPAEALARRLAGQAGMLKVGSQLFTAEGPRAIERLARFGAGIFLDLKFHDIPNTVAGAVASAASLPGVRLVTVHALGGREMMRAAAQARPRGVKAIAVTLLTSLDRASLGRVGISGTPLARAVKLARLAQQAGLDGVVAGAREARAIRRACGRGFLIVVPGIRPGGAARGDQSRVATPAEAIRAGADYLVVGRPITAAADPRAAARSLVAEIRRALRA
jgi:orotidine-5'-phosphate decarboxylase